MSSSTTTAHRALLVHGSGFDPEALHGVLAEEGVRARRTDRLEDLDPGDPASDRTGRTPLPTVLVLDAGHVHAAADLRALPTHFVLVAADDEADAAARDHEGFFMALPADPSPSTAARVLQGAFRLAASRLGADRAQAELDRTRGEIEELNQIGMALMTERDPDRLLEQILSRAMSMTRSDAGSLYLVERATGGERGASGEGAASDEGGAPVEEDRLRFKLSSNRSLPDLPAVEFTLPIDQTSIAGYVAVTNESLVLDDAYAIPGSAPYAFNRGFDEQFGYRAMSMLVVPMADHRDEVVGVLQLINRKRDEGAVIDGEAAAAEHVLPYGEHELSLVQGLAGQAAVSIENARLYERIEDIFESFVRAAVAAIDQRDPTTAGHSVRVAALTTRIADRLPRLQQGRWAGTSLTRDQMKELRYAALLHDFGKVGVREEVLVKARKLPPHLWERVDARFDLIHRTLEKEYLERKLATAREREGADATAALERLDDELADRLRELAEYRDAVARANEPSILPEEGAAILDVLADQVFEGVGGEPAPYLGAEELSFLTIPKGSLNERERKEIESHVTQTYRFLTQIPWTEELRNVASIAYGHHEKLDGKGYPRGVAGEEIPVQTRIMTIADIFDALTASDRPYKRALGADRAIDILRMEAGDGMLDAELVELMVESGVYREVLETDWRDL